ncbi:MAG TPA: FAD:protein FMN transferase [Vicinamibacterales bacterium]|nr:FAD:protein FMN transferase [Vicinamibacterales bacterium]
MASSPATRHGLDQGSLTDRRQFLAALSPRREVASREVACGYWIRVHRRAMACRFEITLAAVDGGFVPAAVRALDEVDRLEQELSVFIPTSAISGVNRDAASGPVAVPAYVAELLTHCGRVHRDTEGAFDVTTTPLSRCWGFLRREARVPQLELIEDARRRVGFDAVHVSADPPSVAFTRPGIEVSLGAVGKGYALDCARSVLCAAGVRHALLSAGGSSIVALGGRGDGWVVDIVSPLRPGRPIATLLVRNAALGTSGAGEQFVVQDGRRYGHVIDPRTGWPVDGTLSASVVTSDAARADALSTAFLVGGLDLARRYCSEHPDVLALITPDDGSERTIVVGSHRTARFVTG